MRSDNDHPEDDQHDDGDEWCLLWQAYGMDTQNNRSGGIYIGCLQGTKEACIEWLEATAPGWRDDFEMGRARISPVTVWKITPEKIVRDRAAHKARIAKGQK